MRVIGFSLWPLVKRPDIKAHDIDIYRHAMYHTRHVLNCATNLEFRLLYQMIQIDSKYVISSKWPLSVKALHLNEIGLYWTAES